MEKMKKAAEKIIREKNDEILSSLQTLLRIQSVKCEPTAKGPFGDGVADALECILDMARKMGFSCHQYGGFYGCIDYGESGELLGIPAHIDVVPEGSGWKYPPYGAEVHDGKLFARGSLDDKGPLVGALYALYAIKEAGIKLDRRVRIIVGCDEESGWACMDSYVKNEPMPDLAFTPDGEYPLVNSEKGILRVTYAREFKSNITLTSGSRPNVVPNNATVTVPFEKSVVDAAIAAVNGIAEFGVETTSNMGGTQIEVTGLGAHASLPEMGKNSLNAALCILSALPLSGDDKEVVDTLHGAFMLDLNGQTLGIDCTDASGRMTVNPGVMRWSENGISDFSIDLRVPTTNKLADILDKVNAKLAAAKLHIADSELKDGHYISPESELCTKLLRVYTDRTGVKDPKPLAIGGGTYARAFDNAVAFGCEFPHRENLIHMPNEYLWVEDLYLNTLIMSDAIIELCAKCED